MQHWDSQVFTDASHCHILYFLTDAKWKSKDGGDWSFGRTRNIYKPTKGSSWLSKDEFQSIYEKQNWFRAFTHPVIAILLNRIYIDIDDPSVWECNGRINHLMISKLAFCSEITTKKLLRKPKISLHTRILFGFGCVAKVYKDVVFMDWLLDWVGCKNRSYRKAGDMAAYCAKQVAWDQKNHHGQLSTTGRAAWAAYWMCWACVAFADPSMIDRSTRLVELWTAQAAVEANLVAHETKLTDFDLITIAEVTMTAK